jgi:hypothetical protein
MAWQFQGRHTHVVHDSHARAKHGASERHPPVSGPFQRQHKSRASNEHGKKQGQDGQAQVEGDGHTRIVGQHRNEMGRPDAEPCRRRIQTEPSPSDPPRGSFGAMKNADGNSAAKYADGDGKKQQAAIVFNRYAG